MKAGRVKRRRIRNKTGYDTQLIARLWARILRDYKNPATDEPLRFSLIIQLNSKFKIGDKPLPTWSSRYGHMVVQMPPVLCPTINFLACLYYFATWGSFVGCPAEIPEFHKIAETYGYNLIDIPNRKKGY